jgi:hypothetical protein
MVGGVMANPFIASPPSVAKPKRLLSKINYFSKVTRLKDWLSVFQVFAE